MFSIKMNQAFSCLRRLQRTWKCLWWRWIKHVVAWGDFNARGNIFDEDEQPSMQFVWGDFNARGNVFDEDEQPSMQFVWGDFNARGNVSDEDESSMQLFEKTSTGLGHIQVKNDEIKVLNDVSIVTGLSIIRLFLKVTYERSRWISFAACFIRVTSSSKTSIVA